MPLRSSIHNSFHQLLGVPIKELSMKARDPCSQDYRKILESISRHHHGRSVFDAFTRLAACALGAGSREKEYLEEAGRWERRDLELFSKALGALIIEMESRPFEDILGPYYTEFSLSKGARNQSGEFHTPKSVCDLMAQILVGDRESFPAEGPITVCEPACGAGAMILSFAAACAPEDRRRLRVTAIDVNPTACDMTYINTTLWGIPTRVIHGDSLTKEVYASWSNIHWSVPWPALLRTEEAPRDRMPERPPGVAKEQLMAYHTSSSNSFPQRFNKLCSGMWEP